MKFYSNDCLKVKQVLTVCLLIAIFKQTKTQFALSNLLKVVINKCDICQAYQGKPLLSNYLLTNEMKLSV